jgi:hypothetical protein
MPNDLVFSINEGLAVIPLDDTVGSHDSGRVIVRNIVLFFSARGAQLGLVLGQPMINQLGLILQLFHLLLPAATRSPGPGRFILAPAGLHLLSQQLHLLGLDLLFFFRRSVMVPLHSLEALAGSLHPSKANIVPPRRFISSQTSSTSLNRGRISSFIEETKAAMVL